MTAPSADAGPPPLLSPELLERLAALELAARVAAEGSLSGKHRSPRRGASVEFAEHKEYAPGDELKHVDWKTYGRSDRLYVKRFEEETELHLLLVVDGSASMRYGAGAQEKRWFASVIAAALAHLLLARRDRAGVLCSDGQAVPVGARAGQQQRILRALASLAGEGRAALPALLRRADAVAPARSQLVVLSDLLDDDRDEVLAAAGSLRARGRDVALVQVLHPDERTLPFAETAWFESPEGEARVLVEPGAARAAYLAELARLVEGWRAGCARARLPFASLDTSTDAGDAVAALVAGPLAPRRRAA